MKSLWPALLVCIVSIISITAIAPIVAQQLTSSAETVMISHNVREMTISGDKKMITVHRALDVNTVLCIERQPSVSLGWSSSNLIISGSVNGNIVEPKPTAPPKEEIVPRVCMTIEKWLATGDAR